MLFGNNDKLLRLDSSLMSGLGHKLTTRSAFATSALCRKADTQVSLDHGRF
jgi:hypothetical protein